MGVELLLLEAEAPFPPFPSEEEDEEEEVEVGEPADATKWLASVDGCWGEAFAEAGGETKSGNATTEDGPTMRDALLAPLLINALSATVDATLVTGNAVD